ncbi:MAG TPA: ABC transporter ATP-binding protein [Chitinophagaceae bacterium]|nr:ABC transporter ATP-binding protein [Chitinophagaceae bacterium]
MSNMILQIENLSVDIESDYEKIRAVKDITFSMYESETLAIVGESGSGKSITALSLMQLLILQAKIDNQSKILFVNKKKESLSLLHSKKETIESIRGNEIAMIFQEPMTSLNPLMTCGKQLTEVIQLHLGLSFKMAKQKAIELFREVKIPQPEITFYKYPHQLSGGQKQRVMIAIAISCHPKILIADEPTTALDIVVQSDILLLLKNLQAKYKMAILFITHDLNVVKHFADRVIVMYKGEIVEMNPVNEIFNHAMHPYTKALLQCRPDAKNRVKFLPTLQDAMNNHNIENNSISDETSLERLEKLAKEKTLFEFCDLHVWYPIEKNFFNKVKTWYKAVDGVNFQIKKGETVGLVGESGCGKTTIGKAIVKLTDITQGDILYNRKSILQFSKSELQEYRRQVQIIFQDPYSSLNPRMSIGNAIKEPMEVHGIEKEKNRKDKVISLLEKVGLNAAHYERYPHEFSGGQRQRICIARALALNSSFLICDESVSALDVSVQAQVLNLLTSLKDEYQFTYLFISHDLNVIKHISDHLAVMQKGKIVEYNNSHDIYFNPQNDYTKLLISTMG